SSACSRTPPATSATAEPPPAFPHALIPHVAVPCADCHTGGTMPKHAACARCHGDWFAPAVIDARRVEKRPCAACHEPQPLRLLASRFSHRLHLDRGRMETATGFHDDCQDCHAPGPDGGAHRADATHAACARCHEARAPQMTNCSGCHGGTGPMEIGRR